MPNSKVPRVGKKLIVIAFSKAIGKFSAILYMAFVLSAVVVNGIRQCRAV